MTFTARPGQDEVLDASDPVLVVLGGAGTGKTTTAAALVRRELDAATSRGEVAHRALFLSFSRSAVSQITNRSAHVLGERASDVEVTTFHAFAWRLVKRWGSALGLADPQLVSPSHLKLLGPGPSITFDDLLPLASELTNIRAIRSHLRRRWAIIVCDEFQDTSDEQFELVSAIRGDARLIFLGDLNQCIYTGLRGATGVGPERLRAALALPDARRIDLPDASHRDPTHTLPAAATAIRRRAFDHPSIQEAISSGMLEVRHSDDISSEGDVVAATVRDLLDQGFKSVGIFSHHVDTTSALSDNLRRQGIEHEVVGLPDALTSALQAQFEMLRFAAGESTADRVWRFLAIFVASLQRGSTPPPLAEMILGTVDRPPSLDERLRHLQEELEGAPGVGPSLQVARAVPTAIGLDQGDRQWRQASDLLLTLLGPRLSRMPGFPEQGFGAHAAAVSTQVSALLTSDEASTTAQVQLMGLYQSKGREADATIVVLRQGDYYGREPEPMRSGSRLLYVVLTRAERRTVVLVFGTRLPDLVEPLIGLRRPAG